MAKWTLVIEGKCASDMNRDNCSAPKNLACKDCLSEGIEYYMPNMKIIKVVEFTP